MTDSSDAHLRRLFAEAAGTLPGESFVTAVQTEMATRRSRRRVLLVAAWTVVAIVLALLLAPVAQSLTGLPEHLATTLEAGATQLRSASIPAYVYWVLAGCALPLAIMGWILGPGRRMY